MSEKTDAQFERIQSVFGLNRIPGVEQAAIETYCAHLNKNLTCPCLLTGIESMGFFAWEERFEFGYGSKSEYERLKKEKGSYHDTYELKAFDGTVDDRDILVKVRRVSDGKKFTIPLSKLQADDEASQNYQLLNDYSVWIVNC